MTVYRASRLHEERLDDPERPDRSDQGVELGMTERLRRRRQSIGLESIG
jgi:hypothetical protein